MTTIVRLMVCLLLLLGSGSMMIQPVSAQEQPLDPVISLTVKDEPLSDVLDAIAQQTGYQFNLTPQWEDHPVSATINELPLEQGLKRLLRSLNYTILWEAHKMVVIKVYGKVTPGGSGGVSFAAPPQDYRDMEESPTEPENEPLDENHETMENDNENQPDSSNEPEQETKSPAEEQPTGQRRPPAGSMIRE